MNVTNYKKQLRKLLNSVSSEYLRMTTDDKEFFVECETISYTVIEPIIRTDIETLERLKLLVKLYID